MIDLLIGILAFFGTIFVLLAAIGLVRMPDAYLRISVTTKAATLGIGLLLIAAAIHFDNLSITTRVMAILLFILLTAPVSAHLIGRTSYFSGIKLWKGSVMDDLEDKYHKPTRVLKSGFEKDEDMDASQRNKSEDKEI
jgi:multicomponent Na+:H+ antiporter subunit G